MKQFFRLNCERSISFKTPFFLRGKAFRGAVRRVTFLTLFYHSSYYSQVKHSLYYSLELYFLARICFYNLTVIFYMRDLGIH